MFWMPFFVDVCFTASRVHRDNHAFSLSSICSPVYDNPKIRIDTTAHLELIFKKNITLKRYIKSFNPGERFSIHYYMHIFYKAYITYFCLCILINIVAIFSNNIYIIFYVLFSISSIFFYIWQIVRTMCYLSHTSL